MVTARKKKKNNSLYIVYYIVLISVDHDDILDGGSGHFAETVKAMKVWSLSLHQEFLLFCFDEKDYEGLPFDIYGGYIGHIGYDLKAECGVASNNHRSKTPDACLFL